MAISELGKMYDEAFVEWQADRVSVDWESLDQTDWESLIDDDTRDANVLKEHLK